MMLHLPFYDAMVCCMRTTVTFAKDTAAIIDEVRAAEGKGVSEVVNELVRRAAKQGSPERPPFVQRRSELGHPTQPLDDIAGLLDALEGPDHRS